MKNQIIILILFIIVSSFLSTNFLKKTNRVEDKWWRTSSTDFKSNSNLSEYEVRITYTGYTAFYGSLQDCQIRKNGKVALSGLLSGAENGDPDDPVLYTGVLQLSIDMDICSSMRVNGEDKLCSMTVTGSGPVKTELEIDTSAGYGYIKIKYDSTLGKFQRLVVGTCDHTQLVEEEKMVPNETIATIFNGRELPMLTNRTLRVGKYIDSGDGGETVVEVLRKVR